MPEKDLHIVVIEKIMFYISDCLRIMEYTFKTRQNAQLKAIKKLVEKVK